MRTLLDTNILISSYIFKGKAALVHQHCVLNTQLYISEFILNEFYEKIEHKFGIDKVTLEEIKFRNNSDFEVAKPKGAMPEICRDASAPCQAGDLHRDEAARCQGF